MRSVVLIPARFNSSRFPGKSLVSLLGKPMVIWVAELSAKAVGIENVYVATDDMRIFYVVKKFGYHAVMTGNALTGTDRLAEAAKQIDADIYINVQGDEPMVHPDDIQKIIEAKKLSPDKIINGFSWLSDDEDPNDLNIPKVITNEQNQLIYMSRVALPGFKEVANAPTRYKKQVCIYAFNLQELTEFRIFGRKSKLENCEDIEILRFLEFGKQIQMIEMKVGSLAVDVPGDVSRVVSAMRKAGHYV